MSWWIAILAAVIAATTWALVFIGHEYLDVCAAIKAQDELRQRIQEESDRHRLQQQAVTVTNQQERKQIR